VSPTTNAAYGVNDLCDARREGVAALRAGDTEAVVIEGALGVPAVDAYVVRARLDGFAVQPVRPALMEEDVVLNSVL
jgi:hypothetical protein